MSKNDWNDGGQKPCDHVWIIVEYDQGDPSTPYYECWHEEECKLCGISRQIPPGEFNED